MAVHELDDDNIASLQDVSEQHVVACLHKRLLSGKHFSFAGPLLVALSPQTFLSRTLLPMAFNPQLGGGVSPYYASATAFKALAKEHHNQALLFLGAANTGKTCLREALTSHLLRMTATEPIVEERIEAVLKLIDLMGSVVTDESDNSTRYAVQLHLQFSKEARPTLVGAKFQTHWLDRSRFSSTRQRNFHALHCLTQGPSDRISFLFLNSENEHWYLGPHAKRNLKNFDEANYGHLCTSLNTIGCTKNEISFLFQILSSVIHIGDLRFNKLPNGEGWAASDRQLFKEVCSLMWLDEKTVYSLLGCSEGNLKEKEIRDNCHHLAIQLYEMAFQWVEDKANSLLCCDQTDCGLITVVDAPGLVEEPTFGALCCNMASEALFLVSQQQLVVGLRAALGEEGIQVPDFQVSAAEKSLNLVFGSDLQPGILQFFSNCFDKQHKVFHNYLTALKDLGKSEALKKVHSNAFTVQHTNGEVTYLFDQLITYGRGTYDEKWFAKLRKSGNKVLTSVVSLQMHKFRSRKRAISTVKSLQHRQQSIVTGASTLQKNIDQLIAPLEQSSPVVTICFSLSRDKGLSKKFVDYEWMSEQMKHTPLPPLLYLSKNSFSEWIQHDEFVEEYQALLPSTDRRGDPLSVSQKICARGMNATSYAIGNTCVLLRGGETQKLEKKLETVRKQSAIELQRHLRGWYARCTTKRRRIFLSNIAVVIQKGWSRYKRLCRHTAATCIQKHWRGTHWRRLYRYFAELRAYSASLIQASWKGHVTRLWYRAYSTIATEAAVAIQRRWRGVLDRRRTVVLAVRSYAASIIQETYLVRYTQRVKAAVRLQRWYRRVIAERAYFWLYCQMNEAATYIQKFVRGIQDRKRVRDMIMSEHAQRMASRTYKEPPSFIDQEMYPRQLAERVYERAEKSRRERERAERSGIGAHNKLLEKENVHEKDWVKPNAPTSSHYSTPFYHTPQPKPKKVVDGAQVGHRLMSYEKHRQQKTKEVERDLLQQERAAHTFQPRINRASPLQRGVPASEGPSWAVHREEVRDRLTEAYDEAVQSTIKAKPDMSVGSAKMLSSKRRPGKVEDRLMKYAELKQKRIEISEMTKTEHLDKRERSHSPVKAVPAAPIRNPSANVRNGAGGSANSEQRFRRRVEKKTPTRVVLTAKRPSDNKQSAYLNGAAPQPPPTTLTKGVSIASAGVANRLPSSTPSGDRSSAMWKHNLRSPSPAKASVTPVKSTTPKKQTKVTPSPRPMERRAVAQVHTSAAPPTRIVTSGSEKVRGKNEWQAMIHDVQRILKPA